MVNKSIFAAFSRSLPATDTYNRAGAPAYAYEAQHALVQIAMTGTFNAGFYGTAETQLQDLLTAANKVEPDFLAQTAIYARRHGLMKDTPAVLLAVLSMRDTVLFHRVFDQIVDNGKMLRNFVQIMRSGAVGRTSLGTAAKRRVQDWLNAASDWQLLNAAIGNAPSLGDVIKMVHPKADTPERNALFAWIMGKPCDFGHLPKAVQEYMMLKDTGHGHLPVVPFQMLTALPLNAKQWAKIAERGSWQMVRMNLNTFARHGVFRFDRTTKQIAKKLSDRTEIRKAKAMPYQLFSAALHTGGDIPDRVREALNQAMEIAVSNVPAVAGRVVVCPDVSGSMTWPVTGYRRGATSKMRCVDVAGLLSAAFLRTNDGATVIPFDTQAYQTSFRASETVFQMAEKLAGYGGGGTDCTVPLRMLNRQKIAPDLVVVISDNQSWAHLGDGRTTPMMTEWEMLKRRNPDAKLVCIDIAPYGTSQVQNRADILNVGGFSDAVFEVIGRFVKGENGSEYWVREVEKIEV